MLRKSGCRGKCTGAVFCNTLCHGSRRPLRSRPRKCTISSSTDVSVVTRPLRRFFRIASRRLLHAIGSPRRSLAILDSVDPALFGFFGNKNNKASSGAADRVKQTRSEEHTAELQAPNPLLFRL